MALQHAGLAQRLARTAPRPEGAGSTPPAARGLAPLQPFRDADERETFSLLRVAVTSKIFHVMVIYDYFN